MNTKTYVPKTGELKREWRTLDADGRVLGRLATEVANILRGKDKPYYTPHLDCGGCVVVTNAAKVKLTGNKLEQKIDFRHSGYPGGDRSISYKKLMAEKPERVVFLAVKGMLQKNRLGNKQIKRLKVYKGVEHPHSAQLAKAQKVQVSE